MASTQRDSSTLLLKTCQTCFQAKIKCERSQESGKCDRCLRLGKACVFNPSRRKRAAQAGYVKESVFALSFYHGTDHFQTV